MKFIKDWRISLLVAALMYDELILEDIVYQEVKPQSLVTTIDIVYGEVKPHSLVTTIDIVYQKVTPHSLVTTIDIQRRIQGGGGVHPARAPPKIGKNMIFFGVKS